MRAEQALSVSWVSTAFSAGAATVVWVSRSEYSAPEVWAPEEAAEQTMSLPPLAGYSLKLFTTFP